MPHFLLPRSGRIGPHCCIFAVFPLYTAWSSWTIHCRRNSPALSVAISSAVLLESSLPRKCSTVFSACLNSSPHPGTDQIPPCPARSSLTIPDQTDGPSELRGGGTTTAHATDQALQQLHLWTSCCLGAQALVKTHLGFSLGSAISQIHALRQLTSPFCTLVTSEK